MVTESAHIQGCHGSRRSPWLLVVLVGWGMLWGMGGIAEAGECSRLKENYGCDCSSSEVRCENKGLEDLPSADYFPEDLKELYLKGNKLKKVDFTDDRFENLEILDLSSNRIESNSGIGKAVKVLKKLEKLYLQGNNLKNIDASYLSGTKIEILDLSNNPVERFVFEETEVNAVRSLYLRDLNYADFPIASLKVFVELKHLDLSGNVLSTLDEGTFSKNVHLEEIHLNNNNLSTLPEKIFEGLKHLKKVYLEDNPWNCDCSLLWLREAMNKPRSIYENTDAIKCTQHSSTALRDVAKEKFTCTIGPATCVQKNKKSMFVTYSARFDVTSDPQCQQECFDRGATYFNIITGATTDECLCGDVNENCTCIDCSTSYDMEPGAKSTISGIKVDYISPVLMRKPVTISLTWVVNFVNMEINFDDGSHAKTTSAKNLAHTFQYPGTFNIQIKLCSSTGNCSHVQMPILVSSFSDQGTMACPTEQYVKTSDPVVLEAKFNYAYNSEIVWTRTAEGESTPVSVACSKGEKHSADGHCFYVVKDKKTWTQALEHCQATQGGSLAVITQDNVSQFLVSLMTNKSVTIAWIGLHKFDDLDNFNWTNGELLGSYSKLKSSDVIRGQCVHMTDSAAWETESCDVDTSFICEYTPNDIVNTEIHIAGSVEIGDTSNAATRRQPTDPSLTSYTLIYMPGLWFNEDGTVQWITYREKDLTNDANLKFVVYRPRCPAGKTLNEPGCGGNQFFSCGDSLSCLTRPTCPSDEQVCYLSELCTRPSQACSCAGQHADSISCTGSPISSGDTPEYDPVGNVTCLNMKAGSSLITLSANLAVKKGDFLGVLYENDAVPIECSQDMNSQWGQRRYSVSGMTGVGKSIPNSLSSVSEHWICHFNALYSKQETMSLPNSLAVLPKSGKYTFSYKVLSTGKTRECTVTAMETVGEIVWVDPAVSTDTIKVELNTVVSLVAKVTAGSNLTYEWTIGGVNVTSNMTLSDSCPSDVDGSLVGCLTNDTSLAKPFTYVQHMFTAKTTLKLKVANKINSVEKKLNVMLGPCMPIQGLTVCHESCDTHSGYTRPCEPLVKAGTKTSFKVKYIQGGVEGKYIYFVNNTEMLKTQDSNYSTTFPTPGLYIIKVNMTCDTHSDIADTQIRVKQPAKATKVKLHIPAGVVFKESFELRVTADVEDNAEVDIIINFGDGRTKSYPIVTSGGKINMVKQYTYNTEKRYTITITVSDPFENVSDSNALFALAAVSVGKIWTEPEYGKPNQQMQFRVNTVPAGGSGLVSIKDSNLYYNWTFPDESKRVQSTALDHTIDHTFKNPGAFNISLGISNPASSEFTSIVANIEICITGLTMEYNGPSRINEQVNFTAYVHEGTNITYSLDADDGKERINQTSATFLVNYSKPGIYNISLIATNDLPIGDGVNFCGVLARAQLTAYVIDNETLFLVDILPDQCFATGEEGVLAAKAISADPAKINYTWDFDNGTTQSGIGLLNVSILYNQPKTYKVSVSNSSKRQHFVKNLCIQEKITNLTISAPAPIRIVPGNTTKENIVTTVKTGSHIKYEWRIGTALQNCNSNSCTINIKNDGKYSFSVNASNNVSHDVDTVVIEAQYIIQNLTLICTTCQNINYLSSAKDAVLKSSAGNATDVKYMYNFGSGYDSGNTHGFTDIAAHEVCVNATNMVSTDKTCMEIVTQDEIQSLTLSSNATTVKTYLEVKIGTIVQFKVQYSKGTNVTLIWDCGDGIKTENHENIFICHFERSRLYNFSVIAMNEVSKVKSTKEMFVIEEITELNISHNLFNVLYAAAGEAQMFTAVGNTELKVTFHWQIKSSDSTVVCETTGKQMEEKCSKFPSSGKYIIELHANNSLNGLSTKIDVIVIDRITGLQIQTDRTALDFNSTTGTNAIFTAKSTGKDLYYRWKVTKVASNTDVKDYNSSSSFLSYTFRQVGEYKVSVNATSALEPQGKYAEKEVSIEEPISGVTIKSQTYLRINAKVTFDIFKSSGSGMNFKWSLTGPGGTSVKSNKEHMTHEFNIIGEYTVTVEVSNQVSTDTDTKTIYVEEIISSVSLIISQNLIRTDTMVPITAVAYPTGLYKYNWTINIDQLTVNVDTFEKGFPIAGVKVVTVRVSNNVSEVTSSEKIFVQEPITGLDFEKCESKVVGEETTLYAVKVTGTNITYTWTVQKPDGDDITKVGNILTVDFDEKAFYNIVLLATNNVSSQSTNCTIKAQARVKIREITVKSNIKYKFINQTIYFEIIGDNLSDAKFTWSFNDSSELQTTVNTHNRTFLTAGTYSLEMTVNNEVSTDVKTKIFSIHILDCKLPKVNVVSKSPATTLRSRYLVLAVSVDTSDCRQYQSKHSWQIYEASSCSGTMGDVMDLGSKTYTETPSLHLKARTLPTGSYCAVFKTYYLDTFVKETVNVTLTVTSSDLKAIIDGGSERLVSADENVNISCRNSFDPDDPKTKLSCSWTCKSTHSSCPWTSRSEQNFVSAFKPGRYTVELMLTDSQSSRTDSTKQTIIVVPEPVPTVSIECVSCQTSYIFKISPGLQVALKTSCSNCGTKAVKYVWKIQTDGTTLTLNSSMTLTGLDGPNLVIKEGIIPSAHSFLFEVSTSFVSSIIAGSSNMQLPGNTAPSGGTCSVTPRDILNLETPVKVTCTGWTDDADEQLFYQVNVKGTTSSGETLTYPMYYGTNSETRLYLASVPNTDKNSVSLEVKILDIFGAFTGKDLGTVTFRTPILDSSTTKTDYIFSKSKSSLPALLKQDSPSLLLPYVIALSQELNQEHSVRPNEMLSKEKRATIRDAITMSLIAIPVTTLEDVQQVAYLLQLLTKYFDEYQTERCHLVIVESLQNITTVLQGYAAQGRNQKHFVPHHLLATISNLIEAVNLGVYNPDAVPGWEEYPIKAFYNDFTNLRPELNSAMEKMMDSQAPSLSGRDIQHRRAVVPSAFGIAEQIVTTILMTTMWTEKSMVINLGGIEVHGQRSKVKEIWDRRELEGCVFYLPENLFEGNPGEEDEIFQILFVLSKNPFTWGYIKNLTINSRVPSLSFKFNDGKTIPLKNLKDSKNIKMYMFENIVQNNKTQSLQNSSLVKSEYYKPLENMRYTRATVKSKKAKLVNLDVSDGATLASGLHVQVRIQAVPNATEEETGVVPSASVEVYLGVNFQANRGTYVVHKRITTADMAEGVDHRNYTIFVSSKDFKVTNSYFLSIYNDVFRDVNISIALYFSMCQYFNTIDKSWSTSGCHVVDESVSTVSACKCNHLTSFGSSMLVPPSVIDITDLVNLDLSTNPVVIIAVSIILFVYLVLVFVFRKIDRLDLKRISMIPLCGKDGSHKFEITVVTGRAMGAGTSAHIGIKLYGQDNKGEARHLTKHGAFQRNCSDTFLVAYDNNLGSLWKILIWHDNTGLSPSWFLSHVIVKDLYSDQKYYFLANLWLSVETETGILKKELTPASKDDLGKFVNSFKTAASHGFADKHLWMSLMDRPDHSRFTRVQRATCAVTVVLFFMMVNAMWYGVFKTDSDVRRSMADYSFSWEEVITGLVSNIIVFPLAVLLITLFKRSRSKENTFQQVQKPLSAQTMEIPCDMSHFGSSFRMTPHGDWDSCYDFTRESTTESIPMTAKLKRTHTLRHVNHSFSQDGSIQDGSEPSKGVAQGKSSVGSLMRTQQLMWSKENILKNWPEKVPTWHDEDRKSTAGTTRGGKATSATTSTSSKGKKTKHKADFVDSDEEFNHTLDELERDLSKDDKRKSRKGKGPGKKSDQNASADGLFSSDDEWVNDGLEDVKSGKAPAGRKSINKTPARAAGATAQLRFNPREDPKLRGTKRPSFCLEEPLSSEDELDKSRGKANKKTVKDLPTGRYTSGKDARERKTSTSSILKKRDSLGRAVSAGSSMKETSFMKQHSYMAMSEKSKSNMSSIWMRNYYSNSHYMRELNTCCMLPSWCVYIAYALCFAISVISIIIVLLYGYNFGPEVSLKWLLSLFLAFCCSALIIEPIKVLILAMYLAARRKDVHEEMEKESIDILPSVQSNETIKDVKFRPLGGFALLQAREEGHKIQRMYVMLRQFVTHMFLLALLLSISFVHYNPHSYISSQNVELHLQRTGSSGLNLSMIKSIPDFRTWTETVLADTLHRQELLPLEEFGVLLGAARFRQIRSEIDDCPISSPLVKFYLPSLTVLPCDGNMVFTEDTDTYSEGWNTGGSNVSWRHHSPQELHMRSKFGQDLLYPGSGYIMPLGSSYNETLSILADLFDMDWINLRTRAVFIEFSFYSPGLDLTTVASVLVEFPISGGVLTSHSLTTQKLLRFVHGRVDPLMVCEVLFFMCVIYLVVHLALTVREQRKKFVRSFWNWLDLIIVSLSLACIGAYIACVVTATDAFGYYTTHKTEFTNFEKSAHLHDVTRYLHAWLLFLFFLKIVHQLRFIKLFHVYGKTVSALLGKLSGCILIFLLMLFAYAQLGYLYFGSTSQRFASFQASLLTLFGVIRGSFNFWLFLTQWPVMTHFYFYSFYAFTYGLFIALVIAVMNDTYKMTRQSMYYKATLDTQDYEMIEFIMKRFKLWTGITKQKPAFRRVKFKGLPSLPSRASTSISSVSRRSSITSSTSSGGEPMLTEAAALYLEHQLDNAVPQWENLLSRVNKIEKLEKEEDQQMKKIEKEFKNWESKKTSPKHKPPIHPSSSFHKFQLNFKGKSQMVNKQKGLIGRTSATPPNESPRKPVTEVDDRRPFSDQGERTDATSDSNQQKKRDSTKNVRFSKQAW